MTHPKTLIGFMQLWGGAANGLPITCDHFKSASFGRHAGGQPGTKARHQPEPERLQRGPTTTRPTQQPAVAWWGRPPWTSGYHNRSAGVRVGEASTR